MDKTTFISEITDPLKKSGYKKYRHYWFRPAGYCTICVFVQGSQWDKACYYVEIGAIERTDLTKPVPNYDWDIRHRCAGANGEDHISPDEFLNKLNQFEENLSEISSLSEFLSKINAVKVANQFFFDDF